MTSIFNDEIGKLEGNIRDILKLKWYKMFPKRRPDETTISSGLKFSELFNFKVASRTDPERKMYDLSILFRIFISGLDSLIRSSYTCEGFFFIMADMIRAIIRPGRTKAPSHEIIAWPILKLGSSAMIASRASSMAP